MDICGFAYLGDDGDDDDNLAHPYTRREGLGRSLGNQANR